MSGPLRTFQLLFLFSLVSSIVPGDVVGSVKIDPVKGRIYSKEDEISKLKYTTQGGKEEIIIRSEIVQSNHVTNCSNNGPCGSGGDCIHLDQDLPIHRVVCHCYSGFRGRYCDEKYRTKLMISFFFWGVFIVEVGLVGIALVRCGDESSYPSSPTARALVFILQERRMD